MLTRCLGRSGIQVSAIGLGCWAIGGPLRSADAAYPGYLSWGEVDDHELTGPDLTAMAAGPNRHRSH